jgi:hypothetical protein
MERKTCRSLRTDILSFHQILRHLLISFEISQTINKPIEEVFAFLSDFTNMPKWNYYIERVTKISAGEVTIGTLYEQHRPHDTNIYKVIVYEPGRKITVELQPPKPLQQYGFELRQENKETRVIYHWQVDLSNYRILKFIPKGNFKNWLLSPARKHIFKNIKPATEQNFQHLKTLLETGQVTLQNARVSKIL